METYRLVPTRDGVPADSQAQTFSAIDDDAARTEASDRFTALASEFDGAILWNHLGDRIDTFGRSHA
jgi:hypothetical protein